MNKILATAFLALALSGCAQIGGLIPSFWDDNQSARMADIRLAVEQFDCARPQLPQIERIRSDIRWFDLYSESKGVRQQDVRRALAPLAESVEEFYQRTQKAEGSKTYCQIKVKNLEQQSRRAAQAVLGRF